MKAHLLCVVLPILAIGLAACATISPRQASTGAIGCAEGEIKILDDDRGMSTRTWKAECRGKRYFCSGTAGPPNHVSCTQDNSASPEPSPAPIPPVSAVASPQADPVPAMGCQYDTQCKGDRVCRDHQCTDALEQKPATP